MATGGYQIVDFKGEALTVGTEKTIGGVYESIAKRAGKPTVVRGLNYGGTEKSGFYTLFVLSSTSYVATVTELGITITVADDDGVTVAAIS